MNEVERIDDTIEEKEAEKVIPFVKPTKIEETEGYKKTAALYKKETEVIDEDYDLLKYAKEYIELYNKFNNELGKCSNLALAGVVDYINKLYATKKSNPACEQLHTMIINMLNTKDPKLDDDVIERYPKTEEERIAKM